MTTTELLLERNRIEALAHTTVSDRGVFALALALASMADAMHRTADLAEIQIKRLR